MELVERIYLLVISKPLVGIKVVANNDSLSLKPATPHLSFGNFFKMLVGHGNNERNELMKTVSLFLSNKYDGVAYDFHGRKLG